MSNDKITEDSSPIATLFFKGFEDCIKRKEKEHKKPYRKDVHIFVNVDDERIDLN